MANSLICTSEIKKPIVDGFQVSVDSSSSNGSSLFQRRIEFHPARKPLSAFTNGIGDFHLETLNPSSDTPGTVVNTVYSALIGKKSEGGDVFDHGLDPEISLGITFRRIGAGLENLGNTCFLNSVLQCLTYTEPFAAYLQSGKHQSSCRTAGFCAMCAIQKHVSRALQSTGRILAPKDLVSNLRCVSRNFRNARQEDAHEYMVNLLESMHKCCLPSGVPSESPSAYDKSLVHKIFGGRLRSQVRCMQCSYCSNTFDPFLDLSLEIVKADSVRKALVHFTTTEELDGGERQYQCQLCKQKVKALKQLTVHKPPYVLTIHLKRFGSLVPGQKIDKKVEFGSTLDLKPFVSGSYEGDLKYTLYGVLVHAGWSTRSGHYYCFVRTSSGMWYSLDDNRVFQVNERMVLEQKAYMLFYVREKKDLATKKPHNAVSRDRMIPNSMEIKNRFLSALDPKTADQNGLVQRTLRTADNSATVTQMDTLSGVASKEPPLKQYAVVKTNGVVLAEESRPKDPILESSQREALLMNSVNGHSSMHSSRGKIVSDRSSQSTPLKQYAVAKTNGVFLAEESLPLESSRREPLLMDSVNGHSSMHSSRGKIVSDRSSQSTPLKQYAVAKTNGVFLAEESLPLESSRREPLLMDSVNGHSSMHSSRGKIVSDGSSQSTHPLVQCNGTSSSLDDATVVSAGAKTSHVNEHGVSRKDLNVPSATQRDCSGSQIPGPYQLASLKPPQKIVVVNERVPNDAPSNGLDDLVSEKVDPGRVPNQSSIMNEQNGVKLNERGASDSPYEKPGDIGLRLTGVGLVEIPHQSNLANGYVQKGALCRQHNLKELKPKKKLAKCQVSGMHFGPRLLYRVSLTLRKKKKHKRNKRHSLELRGSIQKDLLREISTSTDLGPSTSEKTRTDALDKKQTQRLGSKSCKSKRTGHVIPKDGRCFSDNSLVNIAGGDFRTRTHQESAVLATDQPTEKSSSSTLAVNHGDVREPVNLKNSTRNLMQNDLMSMLTRGLDETTVARWDSTELPPSQTLGFGSQQSISIGYMPDEWDEEYDRGKRKKVRDSKSSFGGPNLFQEVATMKTQMKKSKVDQTRSGNRPFRI